MKPGFVGMRLVDSGADLTQLLQDLPASHRQYFLCWAHETQWVPRAAGGAAILPGNFPSPTGEMFTPDYEVRWQASGSGYEVLLLDAGDQPPIRSQFQPLPFDWQVSDPLPTHLLGKGEAQDVRYPKDLAYPTELKLEQRYFHHKQSGTVHFIAHTLQK